LFDAVPRDPGWGEGQREDLGGKLWQRLDWSLLATGTDPWWGGESLNSNNRALNSHFNLMQSLEPDELPRGMVCCSQESLL